MGKRQASHGSGAPAGGRVPRAMRGDAMAEGDAEAVGQGHIPVLLDRCLELIAPALDRADPVHVDATVGLGGHAEAVLAAHPTVRLVGLDRDPEALRRSRARLARYGDRVRLEHAVYDELPDVLARLGLSTVDSVLFDLGVSSMQLDETERGFSYARDAPLDMRMDPTGGITAADVVNTYSAADLTRILRRYGEERFAARIAAAIVRERGRSPLHSSARLAEIVRASVPAPARRTGGHPAKRTFQALRIEVNGELAALEAAVPKAIEALSLGGRIVVLSYHSLEDRIVKQALAARARAEAPIDLPVIPPGAGPTLRLLTRGAELPGPDEVEANPRAASVKLRAAERIDPDAPPPPAMRAGHRRRRPGPNTTSESQELQPRAGRPRSGNETNQGGT